jgi:very-short-patch-repair endonuclease
MGDNPQRDTQRDSRLKELGYKVARIPAADVLKSPESVADSLVRSCTQD